MSEAGQVTEARAHQQRIEAAKNAIGWSWVTLGERLGLTSSQAHALRTAKRGIPGSDLFWLEQLAQAVQAIPRPPIADYHPAGGDTAGAMRGQVVDQAAERREGRSVVPVGTVGGQDYIALRSVIEGLGSMYAEGPGEGASEGLKRGWDAAIEELSAKLGLESEVAAYVKSHRVPPPPKAMQPRPAPTPAAAPVAMERPAAPAWQPPAASSPAIGGSPLREAGNRDPF